MIGDGTQFGEVRLVGSMVVLFTAQKLHEALFCSSPSAPRLLLQRDWRSEVADDEARTQEVTTGPFTKGRKLAADQEAPRQSTSRRALDLSSIAMLRRYPLYGLFWFHCLPENRRQQLLIPDTT